MHSNQYLQNSWNKYGAAYFTFSVIEYCEKAKLLDREQYWIDSFQSFDDKLGYNLAKVAGNTSGIKWTDNQRTLQIIKRTGKKRSQDEKDRISLAMKGKKNRLGTRHTDVTRIKMGNSQRVRNGTDIIVSTVLTMGKDKWQ